MAKARIKREVNIETGVVTFTELATGDVILCDANVLYPMYDTFNDIQRKGVGHFINAKCGDSASDPLTPAIPQIKATWAAICGTVGDGSDGIWSQRGDGVGGAGITDTVTAVHRVLVALGNEVAVEDVATAVASWKELPPTDAGAEKGYKTLFDEKTADTRVKSAKAELRKERAALRAKGLAKEAKTVTDDFTL